MADPREMDFFEHLDELRSRIIRSFVYILVGMCVAWFFKGEIMHIIQTPLDSAIARADLEGEIDVKIFGPSVMSGFSYAIQLALFGGLVFAFPLLVLEAWLFIEPALYPHERKYVYIVIPSSVFLFASGVGLFYLMAPVIFGFLLRFFGILEIEPILDISKYIWLLVRMMLSFGIIFQLPLVVTFLARVGFVDHTMLISKWRHAIVIILVAAAIITPTPDPVNMSLLAGPIMGLYLLSILLARIFGRPRGEGVEEDEEEDDEEDEEEPPPDIEPEPDPEPESEDESEGQTESEEGTETEDEESEEDGSDADVDLDDHVAEEPEDEML